MDSTTSTRNKNGRWQSVTRREPCPACGKEDWCAWAPDGQVLRCMRGGDPPAGMRLIKSDSNGGTLFARNGDRHAGGLDRRRSTAPRPRDAKPILAEMAKRFRGAISVDQRAALAAALGVAPAALEALGVGWASKTDLRELRAGGAGWNENPPEGVYSFEERGGDGSLVGFSLRAEDGRKGAPSRAFGARRGLIVPPTLHGTSGVVLLVEGASDVAAALTLGLTAVGRPSNLSGADDLAKLLKGRDVLVVGENDAKPSGAWPGRDGAQRVAAHLATAWKKPVAWTMMPSGSKDVRSWLNARVAGGLDLADADACRAAGAELLAQLQGGAEDAEPQRPPSQSEQIVRLAHELYRIGRTDRDEPFAVPHAGPNVAILFRGGRDALRGTLAREFRRRTQRTPSATALTDALTALSGEALEADTEPVALRVAMHEENIVIDLGDGEGRSVVVSPGKWDVVEAAPVLFRRTSLTAALPVPESGGKLSDLKDLLNMSAETFKLVVGWLVAAFLPNIPHPILLLNGIHGTGKSTAARTLVSLFDPSPAPLRSQPRDPEQWAFMASGSWGVAIDNLSGIPAWFSDALCKAATGDGWVRRALYTDSDLAVLSFRRVLQLTSIDAGALRGDLGDRLVLVDLEAIPAESRRTETELDRLLAERRPRILGALLDALAAVLERLPTVQVDSLPRMADFGRVLAALDETDLLGGGALELYRVQSDRVAAEVIDGDPFALAIMELLMRKKGGWQGTAGELLEEVKPEGTSPQGWPKNGQAATGRLKRILPALAAEGVVVRIPKERTKRGRIITLEAAGQGSSPSSPQLAIPQEPEDSPSDDRGDDLATTISEIVTALGPGNTVIFGPDDAGDDGDDPACPFSDQLPADDAGDVGEV